MTSTATVRRATGATTTNPTTLEEEPVMAVTLSAVPCRIRLSRARPGDASLPGQVGAEIGPEWHIPVSTTGVKTGDRVTIDTVDPISGDPDLVGQVFRVEGPSFGDYATARRFRVELVS